MEPPKCLCSALLPPSGSEAPRWDWEQEHSQAGVGRISAKGLGWEHPWSEDASEARGELVFH